MPNWLVRDALNKLLRVALNRCLCDALAWLLRDAPTLLALEKRLDSSIASGALTLPLRENPTQQINGRQGNRLFCRFKL